MNIQDENKLNNIKNIQKWERNGATVETTVDFNSKTKGVFSDEINNPFVAAKIWLLFIEFKNEVYKL